MAMQVVSDWCGHPLFVHGDNFAPREIRLHLPYRGGPGTPEALLA